MITTAIKLEEMLLSVEHGLDHRFKEIDETSYINQARVLEAFRNHRLSEAHFAEQTGYAMDDAGRETLDKIFAEIMGAEAAAVRLQFVSGTHAIAAALFGNLRPGERLATLTGSPYDTLHQVFGHKRHVSGSLCDLGVEYIEDFIDPNLLDQPETEAKLKRLMAPPTSLVHIQKSRGYAAERRTLSNRETELLCSAAKKINPNVIVFVDNCYGEFVETSEPPHHGADLIAGSLIKNPGGGLAVCGGYVAGKRAYVVRTLERLTAPGIGGHLGCLYNQGRLLFHGLFIAPSVVASAVKGAVFLASVLEELGYRVLPAAKEIRFDIIQAVELKNREALIAFQRAIQAASPVNSHVAPIPAIMPGYDDEVIMAGGSFIQGSTIELSSDGPLRAPYMAYFQGSLTYGHVRYVVRSVAASLLSL